MSAFATGTRLRLVELGRQPTTLALLVALPIVVVETYGVAMASFPQLPSLGVDPATAGRLSGALFATAFLSGVVGLFQVISAREGDDRLVLCGYPRWTLLATRLVTTVAVAGVAAAVSLGAVWWRLDVAAPVLAFGVLWLAGLLYGLLGVAVGTVLPRELEGSLVLVFVADLDNALSSGLFDATADLATWVPMYHPHALLEAAVVDGTLATGHLEAAAVVAAVLFAAVLAVTRLAGGDGA